MHHLVGRLSALDPEAGETLRIVSYFDVLLTRGAGLDGLLRGAAVLSGTVAGAEIRGRVSRRDPDGRAPTAGGRRSPQRSHGDWTVWLERDGEPEPHDEMIVERLALGVELIEGRRRPEGGFDAVIDPARTVAERVTHLARHRLDAATPVRILATAADTGADAPGMDAPSAIVPTRYGLLRATLDVFGKLDPPEPVGFGTWVRADQAPESWDAAIVALRLTDEGTPAVDATELGAMLQLAQAYDPREPHEDVRALAGLDARSADVLRTLVEADSIRSAAAELGMHHSTVQARHEALTHTLGYDPRSNLGRMRYIAAALLLRLTEGGQHRRSPG